MSADPRADDKVDPKVLKTALILVVRALAVVFDTTIVSVALHELAAEPARAGLDDPVGEHRLHARARRDGAAQHLGAGPVRRQAGLDVRPRGLPRRLDRIESRVGRGSLIGWRVVQGLGGGLMLPVMTTLIMRAAGGRALGRTTTLGRAAPGLLGPILGPLVGGAIITDLSWRFMFWVNVPFCVAGLILAGLHLDADPPPASAARPRLDAWASCCSPGHRDRDPRPVERRLPDGFGRPDVIAPLAVGVAFLLAFTIYALRRRDPLVDVRLLAARSVGSSSSLLFLSGFSLYGAMLLLPLYYQEVRGVSALTAGLMLVPQGIRDTSSAVDRRTAHRPHGGPPDRRRGVPRRRGLHRAVLPRRRDERRPAARVVAADPRRRTRRRHHAGHDRRVRRARPRPDRPLQRARPAPRSEIGGSFGTAVLAVILEQSISGAGTGAVVPGFHTAFWWATGFLARRDGAQAAWLPGAGPGPRRRRCRGLTGT